MIVEENSIPLRALGYDIVGYLGNGRFVLLRPAKHHGNRVLPPPETDLGATTSVPLCTVGHGQVVRFPGLEANQGASLIYRSKTWFFQPLHEEYGIKLLEPNTFFEIQPR